MPTVRRPTWTDAVTLLTRHVRLTAPPDVRGEHAGDQPGEHDRALNGCERHSMVPNRPALTCGSCVSAGQRTLLGIVHTEEVTGSIPVSPTPCFAWSDGLSMIFIGGPFGCLGSRRGARPAEHLRGPKCSRRVGSRIEGLGHAL